MEANYINISIAVFDVLCPTSQNTVLVPMVTSKARPRILASDDRVIGGV